MINLPGRGNNEINRVGITVDDRTRGALLRATRTNGAEYHAHLGPHELAQLIVEANNALKCFLIDPQDRADILRQANDRIESQKDEERRVLKALKATALAMHYGMGSIKSNGLNLQNLPRPLFDPAAFDFGADEVRALAQQLTLRPGDMVFTDEVPDPKEKPVDKKEP